VKPIAVYDGHTRKRLAYLQNAYNISYEQPINALWTASFSLPYSDKKNIYCSAFNLIELWDVSYDGRDVYVGLFRIMPRVEDILGTEASIEYTLEHVLNTLLDDVMLGWHEIGNLGVYTKNVISYILENQTEQRWLLSQCDYDHQYLYGWQDENLLSALYSVVEPFSDTDYYWDFDTKSFPWRLKLLRITNIPVSDIRYRKNLSGITRTVDPTNLTTRLYCYGYGEGDNKLNIKSVNGGIPYLESANVSTYGVITQIWTDERYTIEESLKEAGMAILQKFEEPIVTYEIDVRTILNANKLVLGDTVRVVGDTFDDYMVVQKISKKDISAKPYEGTVVIGKGTIDASDSIAGLAEKQRISETYAQGAESIFTDGFYDNADASNPALITFYIPDNTVHVNEILLTVKLTNFKASSKATKSDGGGAILTSTLDGGFNRLQSTDDGYNYLTSTDNGYNYIKSSDDGGKTYNTSGDGGKAYQSTLSGVYAGTTGEGGGGTGLQTTLPGIDQVAGMTQYPNTSSTSSTSWNGLPYSYVLSYAGSSETYHTHGIYQHTHGMNHYHEFYANPHSHFLNMGTHYHSFSINTPHDHWVYLNDHQHSVTLSNHSHWTTIPNHHHYITTPDHHHYVTVADHSHKSTLPNHVHQFDFGIYKGTSASSMDLYLDDVLIGNYSSSISKLNLISTMSKNANGDVLRGEHEIKIVPNALTRVEGYFLIRLFTNSHGGQQY